MRAGSEALVADAQRTMQGVAERAGLSLTHAEAVAMGTCYTMGFEAGLALALRDGDVARRVLADVDHDFLRDDPRAAVQEREQYVAHYVQAMAE